MAGGVRGVVRVEKRERGAVDASDVRGCSGLKVNQYELDRRREVEMRLTKKKGAFVLGTFEADEHRSADEGR